MENLVIEDKRTSSGYEKPIVEIHGKVEGFVPAGDYVLIKRLAAIKGTDLIARPDIGIEKAERGVVIAVSKKAAEQDVPVGAIAKFSKYAEEISFDDAEQDEYALVRIGSVRGWHNA